MKTAELDLNNYSYLPKRNVVYAIQLKDDGEFNNAEEIFAFIKMIQNSFGDNLDISHTFFIADNHFRRNNLKSSIRFEISCNGLRFPLEVSDYLVYSRGMLTGVYADAFEQDYYLVP